MALGRVVELSIGSQGEGLLISALDIDFKIVKSLTFADNYAEFRIYNAKAATRTDLLKKGNNLIFKAGYEDETINTLFVGNINEVLSGKSITDRVVDIKAITSGGLKDALNSQYVSLSFAPQTLLTNPIQQLASLAGLVVYGAENANIALPNGWQYVGKLSGAFRYINGILKSKNIGMYKDNKELVIFNEGVSSRISVVTLAYSGGLKSIKKKTDNAKKDKKTRYEFESLIIPQCQVNAVVNIQTDEVKGNFTVEKLEYTGNNYGGDFQMKGEVFL